jgi:F420-dependent oxidoreductase-like protein
MVWLSSGFGEEKGMKFGFHNSSFEPVNGRVENIFPELRDRARWADTAGFDYFSVMDHLFQIPGVGPSTEPFMEAWVTLGALADATRDIYLTTLVSSVSYRNPALLAKMVTTLDLISGGRAILGIGGGWYQPEYDGYGYGFPSAGVRLAQLREAVQIIKAMWSQPRATYRGHYFSVTDVILEPKPIQIPHPRILIGGGGEKVTLNIVANEADMCNFAFAGPEDFKRKVAVLRNHCDTAGKNLGDIEITKSARIDIALSHDKAEEKWKARGGARSLLHGLTGTPDEVIRMIRELESFGMQGLFVSCPTSDIETRELFAEKVIPAFK